MRGRPGPQSVLFCDNCQRLGEGEAKSNVDGRVVDDPLGRRHHTPE